MNTDMKIFQKEQDQTVILVCLNSLRLPWFKCYRTFKNFGVSWYELWNPKMIAIDLLTSLLFSRLFIPILQPNWQLGSLFWWSVRISLSSKTFFYKKFQQSCFAQFLLIFLTFCFCICLLFAYQKLQKSKKCYYFKMAPRSIFLRLSCTFQMQLVKRRHNMMDFRVQIWKFWLIPSILSIKCS